MLDSLLSLLPTLEPQPIHFRHGQFQWDAAQATWTPAPGPDPDAFPLLMAATPRVRFSEDLNTETWDIVLLYAEPHAEDLSDVPHIHHRALRVMHQVFAQWPAAADALLAAPPELVFFHNSGPQRLAGVQAAAAVSRASTFSTCCP